MILFLQWTQILLSPEKVLKKWSDSLRMNRLCLSVPPLYQKKPKNILQKIQNLEYLGGLFLRKVFASINSIYISPGAFSAYRKKFFDKYGGYDENNLTEDLEIALRIQVNGFRIENCPDAFVYTSSPEKFKELLIQRRRWYYGLIKNLLNYKKIISPKYGDLGAFVLPVTLTGTFLLIFILSYSVIKSVFNLREELLFLQSINFNFSNYFDLNSFVLERFLFSYVSDPITTLVLISLGIMSFYIFYGARKIGRASGIIPDMVFFFLFFSLLYSFWWIVSIFYTLFSKRIKWR